MRGTSRILLNSAVFPERVSYPPRLPQRRALWTGFAMGSLVWMFCAAEASLFPAAAGDDPAGNAWTASRLSFHAGPDSRQRKSTGFIAQAPEHRISLTSTHLLLFSWRNQEVLKIKLGTAGRRAEIEALDPLPGRVNYMIGNDPGKWRRDIPTFARIRYRQIYEGVDLIFYGTGQNLEFDFVVAPGADQRVIKIMIDGRRKLKTNSQGDLLIEDKPSPIVLKKPLIYQEIEGIRRRVPGRYVLRAGNTIGFRVPEYDRRAALVIDPVLKYATYLGGDSCPICVTTKLWANSRAQGIAVDRGGNAYVTGSTTSPYFPLASPFQSTIDRGDSRCIDMQEHIIPCYDAFITKFRPTGEMVYSTYLGGSSWDVSHGIAVDDAGNAYVAGDTRSLNFPITDQAFQKTCAASPRCADAFVAKLDPAGSRLIYSTYLGGKQNQDFMCATANLCTGNNAAYAVAVDDAGHAFVAGATDASDFPVRNALQPAFRGCRECSSILFQGEAFLAKLEPDGSRLEFSTYLGGSGDDTAVGLALNAAGDAFVAGTTNSADFPVTPGALQTTGRGLYVARVKGDGSALVYSTYVGNAESNRVLAMAVDLESNAYITGETQGYGFPLVKPFSAGLPPYGGAFIAKLNPSGSALIYSSYLNEGSGVGIAVDDQGAAHVTGMWSDGFGALEAHVSKIDPSGLSVLYSKRLGGSKYETGQAIAVDIAGDIFVAGSTDSTDFPTVNAFQSQLKGPDANAFVARLTDPKQLFFPQFGTGQGFISELVLANPSDTLTATGQVEFLDNDGQPFQVEISDGKGGWQTASRLDISIPPLGSLLHYTSGKGPLAVGSARVTTDEPLGGVVRFSLPGLGIAGVGACAPNRGFITPVRRKAGGINTGVAVHNAESRAVRVVLTLFDKTGKEAPNGRKVLEDFPAYGHLARFIDELFPQADTADFAGTLVIRSETGKISATAIELGIAAGEFTTLPMTPLRF